MVLLGICGSIITISGMVAVIVKFWKWAHKQSDDNATTLNEVETYLASDKRRIESLEKRQNQTEEMNKLQLKALVTLLGHEIDGNHTSQLIEVRDEIQTYLISK